MVQANQQQISRIMNLKLLIVTVFLVAGSAAALSQSLFVQQKDGIVHEYVLNEVSQVTFGESKGKHETRIVTYYANDGTDEKQVSESHVAKSYVIGNGVIFSRENFVFTAWNTKPDGSGATFQNGETCVSQNTLYLYAQWKQIRGSENGHEWVDLGLPSGTKWATTNIGAETPEAYGDYFAWGETETYNSSSYKFGPPLTKYCTNTGYGRNNFKDDKIVLEESDDAASVNWGDKWRMPTIDELEELINQKHCIWRWTTINDVYGYLVTSKENGASIFFPAAGYRSGSDVNYAGALGNCWTSSLCVTEILKAHTLFFSKSSVSIIQNLRYGGFPIRPILK